MKQIFIYVGRFQPFHPGHYNVYKTLINKYGYENVYIATSENPQKIKEPIKYPFNIDDKILIMVNTIINNEKDKKIDDIKNKIIITQKMYNPEDLLSLLDFDPYNTSLVYVIGEKDSDRLKSSKNISFLKYDKGTLPVKTKKSMQCYILIVPNEKIQEKIINATDIRNKIMDKDISKKEKMLYLKNIYGFEDKEIFNKIINSLNKLVSENILRRYIRKIIIEGGHTFKNIKPTYPIKKENINNTIKNYINELENLFPGVNWKSIENNLLGSAGKKPISGDIDIAVDVSMFFNKNGTPKLKEFNFDKKEYNKNFNLFKSRARTSTDEQIAIKTFLFLICNFIKNNSDLIICKLGNAILLTQFPQYDIDNEQLKDTVQIDLMVGNIGWLKFAYYSDEYKDNVKGLHRTQLLLSLYNYKQYLFKHSNGIYNKNTNKLAASSSEEAINLLNDLYNFDINTEILKNYFTLYDYIKNNLSKKDFEGVINIYLKILDSTNCDIPLGLQDYWIKNKDKLQLKGKFLPNDSNLKKYVD